MANRAYVLPVMSPRTMTSLGMWKCQNGSVHVAASTDAGAVIAEPPPCSLNEKARLAGESVHRTGRRGLAGSRSPPGRRSATGAVGFGGCCRRRLGDIDDGGRRCGSLVGPEEHGPGEVAAVDELGDLAL